MLTQDDGGPDGRKIRYLSEPDRWRHHDPELHDRLREALSAGRRSVDVAEQHLLPAALTEPRHVAAQRIDREEYFGGLLRGLATPGLPFFDPDNGLEVKSKPIGRKGAEKYLYWDELEGFYRAGYSCLVYQHFPRVKPDPYIRKLALQTLERLGAPWVASLRTSRVLFLLAPQEQHQLKLEAGLRRDRERWSGQVSPALHNSQ
jgi:hypothetical protein